MRKNAVFITGGAQRIGKGLVLGLVAKGFPIILHYWQSEEKAQELAQEIQSQGGQCTLFQADFSDSFQLERRLKESFPSLPPCSTLINNASIFEAAPFLETDAQLLNQHFQVNFTAPFLLTQAFARHCSGKGSVINLIDTRVHRIDQEYFAYTLSKKLLFDLTKMAASSLAPEIRVNGICPGLILPPKSKDISYLEEKSQKIPLRTHGSIEDIFQAVEFFMNNSFVTGECLCLDGGEHLGPS